MEANDVGGKHTGHELNRCTKGVKCTYLENLSTTVRMTDLPPM